MRFVLIVFSWILLFGSCTFHKSGKEVVIPKQDWIHIIEDIHIANGFFSMSYLRRKYPGTDSISNYRDVIGKYGYTMKDFYKTLDYYTDHMNEYEAVYEVVMKDLKEMQENTYKEEMMPMGVRRERVPAGLWTEKTEWHVPREGQRNRIPFSVEVKDPGVYTLSMRIRVGKNDGSKHPHISAWFWYDDGTEEGHRIHWKEKRLVKGDGYRQYILSKALKDTLVTHLKGFLLDDENTDTLYIKHADIRDIRLDVKPFHTGAEAGSRTIKKDTTLIPK